MVECKCVWCAHVRVCVREMSPCVLRRLAWLFLRVRVTCVLALRIVR